MSDIVPIEKITRKIYIIRDTRVMLDRDLAELYGVETKALKQAVRRNITRFPEDFMFELTKEESRSLRSQNVTLNRGQHSKYPPYAFTEHGILMLSSVLRSERAEKVNILIIDTFIKLRELLLTRKDVLLKLEKMENKIAGQDEKIKMIFDYLRHFIKENERPRKRIGFKQGTQ